MGKTPTRRTVLTTALATGALAAPFVRTVRAAIVPAGKMVLAWHTNIAPRWLDPQQHDGGATPDNFLNALHDALIKNFRTQLYDHLALARGFEFAEDAESATFRLRPGLSFHDGRRQMEFRALSRRLGRGHARQDKARRDPRRAHDPLRLQGSVSRFSATVRHRQCLRRRMGGAGPVLPAGRAKRVRPEADRGRALPADRPDPRQPARFRGLRTLLPAGAYQILHDQKRAGRRDPRRHARAR